MELFFESRTNFSDFTGDFRTTLHQPDIHPEPILVNDQPGDLRGASIYGTVIREGGLFRMWYQAKPQGVTFTRQDTAAVGYAESDNGIDWRKPALRLVDIVEQPNNLCNLSLHCPSVVMVPGSDPAYRYRATGYGSHALAMSHEKRRPGYYTMHSADGLHWEPDQDTPQWPGGDVISSAYHPMQGRILYGMKYYAKVGAVYRRCIHTAEWRAESGYTRPVSALVPDEFDDISATVRGYASCDYYGMGFLPAGSGTIGFLWNYWHSLPYTTVNTPGAHVSDNVALYGVCDVSLVYQCEPGGRWFHLPGRPTFIDRRHRWMKGMVFTASTPIEVGNEHWLYITGKECEHGYHLEPDWNPNPRRSQLMPSFPSRIGLVRWPKYRLFGLKSSRSAAVTVNLGELSGPVELKLNYKTAFGGFVRVEVLDHPVQSGRMQTAGGRRPGGNGHLVVGQPDHPQRMRPRARSHSCRRGYPVCLRGRSRLARPHFRLAATCRSFSSMANPSTLIRHVRKLRQFAMVFLV